MSLLLNDSFLLDDEPGYDVFNFNDVCPIDFIAEVASACDTSAPSLNLKPLLDYLTYVFSRS